MRADPVHDVPARERNGHRAGGVWDLSRHPPLVHVRLGGGLLCHCRNRPLPTDVEIAPTLHAASSGRAEVLVDAVVPAVVRFDRNLVLHVLENLVTNAAKYGPTDGRVALCASPSRPPLVP